MKPVSLVILGGGTSGWISAAWLTKQFGVHPNVEITLVESKSIGILGVGEATVPSLLSFLRMLEVPEAEFMRATKATFKHGILYKDWLQTPRPGGSGHAYFHPFDGFDILAFNPGNWWLAHRSEDPGADYARDICAQYSLAMANLAPRTPAMPQFEGEARYAYHFDAELFAAFLTDWCKQRGVRHILDDVLSADADSDGYVASLSTKSGLSIPGDIFIDCSGFRGMLINSKLGQPFIGYGDGLFCDQAVAIRLPHEEQKEIRPYTTTTAWSDGWLWEIDLTNRSGVGYVHSSRHTSFEEAELALRRHIGPRFDQVPVRRVKMRVGRSAKFWDKNVIAVGLSGGFIEPLESTGIYFVELGARMLAKALTGIIPLLLERRTEKAQLQSGAMALHEAVETLSRRYNRTMIARYEEIRDFVKLHFFLSRRKDSQFWRDNRNPSTVSAELLNALRLWSIRAPDSGDFEDRFSLFNHVSWLYILLGMGWRPRVLDGENSFASSETGALLLKLTNENISRGMAKLPLHRDYLDQQQPRAAGSVEA